MSALPAVMEVVACGRLDGVPNDTGEVEGPAPAGEDDPNANRQ